MTVQLAPLGFWERRISWTVWIIHSLGAFLIAWNVSTGAIEPWIKHWLAPSSYVDDMKMDLSDSEWLFYRQTVVHLCISYGLNSIGFFFCLRLLSVKSAKLILISVGIALQMYMTSVQCVTFLFLFGSVVTIIICFTRSHIISWFLCIAFVVRATQYVPFSLGEFIYYREFNLYLYGAIKILNFCLFLCKNPSISYSSVMIDHLLYMSYLPYSMTLIVLFEDFSQQYERLQKRVAAATALNDIKHTLWFGIRLIFWFFFVEAFLHFIHIIAIFNSPFPLIGGLKKYEMAAIAYVAGQFFHVKYFVIFGIPSFFAYLDGMQPPPPPICISRVSRYSRMWRHFDAGLYQFLKNQVYIPLMKPKLTPLLSMLRSLLTLVAVFSVVLAWHGTTTHYICWVTLSSIELVIEKIGLYISTTEKFSEISRGLGPIWTRRLVALSMLATVIPGIFGVFFFLGREGIGEVIFNQVLINGFKDLFTLNISLDSENSGILLIQLLILGYFFNNVCLDIDQKHSSKKVK